MFCNNMADVIIMYPLMMCANSFRHVFNDPRRAYIHTDHHPVAIPCPARTTVDIAHGYNNIYHAHDYDDVSSDNVVIMNIVHIIYNKYRYFCVSEPRAARGRDLMIF